MFAKNCHLHWIAGGANILCKYIIYCTYFSISGVAFVVPFLCYFQKLQLLVLKNCELIFVALYFYYTRYFQLKSSLSDEKKTSAVTSEIHFSKEAIENYCGKLLKKNYIVGRSWSSAKVFIVQNYTENTNGDVDLTAQNVWYISFLWAQGAHMFFLYKG